MELYNMIKNIYGQNNEAQLVAAISTVKNTLSSLTEERMCKVYSSYLLSELSNRHVPTRLINTSDLGLNYEHLFILVPSNDTGYFLADLTFSQFDTKNEKLKQLLECGYQPIDDESLNHYLSQITKSSLNSPFSVEDIFYLQDLPNPRKPKLQR